MIGSTLHYRVALRELNASTGQHHHDASAQDRHVIDRCAAMQRDLSGAHAARQLGNIEARAGKSIAVGIAGSQSTVGREGNGVGHPRSFPESTDAGAIHL